MTPQEIEKRVKELFPNIDHKSYPIPENPKTGNFLKRETVDFLFSLLLNSYTEELIKACWPNRDGPMIAMWQDEKQREKGFTARRSVKPMKAFRHIFPGKTDQELEKLVDAWKAETTQPTIEIKKTQDKIAEVYQLENGKTDNISCNMKSLANSCMRYVPNYFGQDHHPCEAYENGEWTLWYVIDECGKIHARAIVNEESQSYGPIYAANAYSGKELRKAMHDAELRHAGSEDWVGSTLKLIEGRQGGYLAPYLDIEPREVTISRDSLIIDESGNLSDYSHTTGEYTQGNSCHGCRDIICNDEELIGPDDYIYCENCFHNDFTICERSEETARIDETVPVWVMHCGRPHLETWSDHAFECDGVETESGENWAEEDCHILHNGEYISERDFNNGDYVLCYETEELYHFGEVAMCDDGEYRSLEWLKDNNWQLKDDGEWFDPQEKLELAS